MSEAQDLQDALYKLVLAIGHDVRCPSTAQPLACACGKAQMFREAHSEACRLLRAAGVIK